MPKKIQLNIITPYGVFRAYKEPVSEYNMYHTPYLLLRTAVIKKDEFERAHEKSR
jgi:hypothetical protein